MKFFWQLYSIQVLIFCLLLHISVGSQFFCEMYFCHKWYVLKPAALKFQFFSWSKAGLTISPDLLVFLPVREQLIISFWVNSLLQRNFRMFLSPLRLLMLSVNSETDGIVVSEASPEDILCEHSGAALRATLDSGVLISDVRSLSFFMIFSSFSTLSSNFLVFRFRFLFSSSSFWILSL